MTSPDETRLPLAVHGMGFEEHKGLQGQQLQERDWDGKFIGTFLDDHFSQLRLLKRKNLMEREKC